MLTAQRGDVPGVTELWLWLGGGGLAVGALLIAVLGIRARREDKSHFVLGFFICTVAAVAYWAMASGQLDYRVGAGDHVVYLPRYLDWSVTTPLLLLSIALVALPTPRTFGESRERTSLLTMLMGSDVLMIATGTFGSLTATETTKWIWFGVSCGFYAGVVLVLLEVLRRGRERSGSAPNSKLAATLATILLVLWLFYPVNWALGTEGAGWWGSGTETAIYAVLDVLAKTVFTAVAGLGILRIGRGLRAAAAPHEDVIDAAVREHGDGSDGGLLAAPGTPAGARAGNGSVAV